MAAKNLVESRSFLIIWEKPPWLLLRAHYQTVRGSHPEDGSKNVVESRSFLIIWDKTPWLILASYLHDVDE